MSRLITILCVLSFIYGCAPAEGETETASTTSGEQNDPWPILSAQYQDDKGDRMRVGVFKDETDSIVRDKNERLGFVS